MGYILVQNMVRIEDFGHKSPWLLLRGKSAKAVPFKGVALPGVIVGRALSLPLKTILSKRYIQGANHH